MGVYILTLAVEFFLKGFSSFLFLIWPNVTRSCMSSFFCKLFGRTLGDSGILCFNFSEAFVISSFDLTFVINFFFFCDTICYFIVWTPKATQLMGVPFDWATIAFTNVIDSCLSHCFPSQWPCNTTQLCFLPILYLGECHMPKKLIYFGGTNINTCDW